MVGKKKFRPNFFGCIETGKKISFFFSKNNQYKIVFYKNLPLKISLANVNRLIETKYFSHLLKKS